MNRADVDRLLEEKMVSYAELQEIPVVPDGDELVAVTQTDSLLTRQIDPQMLAVTGPEIYARRQVCEMLRRAADDLAQMANGAQLEVAYGYRSLDIQTRLFEENRSALASEYSGAELMEAVHRRVAVPTVAGHPTGGAVDVHIVGPAGPWETGSAIWEFVPDAYVFTPFISRPAWENRQRLRQVMLGAGFAPFDGEWWHFSYGDREWARYYNRPHALYEQVEFQTVSPDSEASVLADCAAP